MAAFDRRSKTCSALEPSLRSFDFPALLRPKLPERQFRSARRSLAQLVRGCVSGRELIDRGIPQDVEEALHLNVSATAPHLVNGAFID
jgi:hypothetical protein